MTVIKSGINGNTASVSDDNRLLVASVTETGLEFVSKEDGKAFSWVSTYSATAADEVLSIKNTSTSEVLVIEEVVIGSSVANVFTLFEVTSGTAAGTTLTAANMNLGSGNTAASTAYGNAAVTGSLSGTTLAIDGVVANSFDTLDLKGGLILQENDEIAITTSATGTVYISVLGHYDAR